MVHGDFSGGAAAVVFDPLRRLAYFAHPGTQAPTVTGRNLIVGLAEFDGDGVVADGWEGPCLWGAGDDLLAAVAAGSVFEFPDGVDLERCHVFALGDPDSAPATAAELAEMPQCAGWLETVSREGAPKPPRERPYEPASIRYRPDAGGTSVQIRGIGVEGGALGFPLGDMAAASLVGGRDDLCEGCMGEELERFAAVPGTSLARLLGRSGARGLSDMDPDGTVAGLQALAMAAGSYLPRDPDDLDEGDIDAVLCSAFGGRAWDGAPPTYRLEALASAIVAVGEGRCRYVPFDDGCGPAGTAIPEFERGRVSSRLGSISVESAAMTRGRYSAGEVVLECCRAEIERAAKTRVEETLAWYRSDDPDGQDACAAAEEAVLGSDRFRDWVDGEFIQKDIDRAYKEVADFVRREGRLPDPADLPDAADDALVEAGLREEGGSERPISPDDLASCGLKGRMSELWPWADEFVEYTSANPPEEVWRAVECDVYGLVLEAAIAEEKRRVMGERCGWRPRAAPGGVELAPRGPQTPASVAGAAVELVREEGRQAARRGGPERKGGLR